MVDVNSFGSVYCGRGKSDLLAGGGTGKDTKNNQKNKIFQIQVSDQD